MSDVNPLKIALVDDHEMIHQGIKLLLRNDERYHILHSSFDGKQALENLEKQPVDLVLSDISMLEMNGIELTKSIKKSNAEVKVLLLSMHEEDEWIYQAIDADADGYVLKNTSSEELKNAIDKVMNGGMHYSEPVIQKITKGFKDIANTPEPVTLSDREIEVVQLICDELTTKEIAEKLFLSPNTIETHRKNILRKTGVRSTVGLVKFAIVNQLVAL